MSPELRRLAPSLSSLEWVLLFVLLEHILLGIRYLLHIVIPERPEWVRVALARINHQSKQALKNEVTEW
jgi:anoctamin-10